MAKIVSGKSQKNGLKLVQNGSKFAKQFKMVFKIIQKIL